MRIFRMVFILSAIAVFLPTPPEDPRLARQHALTGEEHDYVDLATGTFSDLASFCERKPAICRNAGSVAHSLELKAMYGVRLLYDWTDDANPSTSMTVVPKLASRNAADRQRAEKRPAIVSQSTLRVGDLIPAWRNPATT